MSIKLDSSVIDCRQWNISCHSFSFNFLWLAAWGNWFIREFPDELSGRSFTPDMFGKTECIEKQPGGISEGALLCHLFARSRHFRKSHCRYPFRV